MPKRKKTANKPIEQYEHKDKDRLNNPPVGLVNPETDIDSGKTIYSYDPHLDPTLQWSGKAERLSFDVPTRSLHVHERIDPRTIIETVRKKQGKTPEQPSLFSLPSENPPIREAIEFYKHKHNWSNRLIAGDSLLVMNSLLEKEGMAGKVQMIYIDPPYGIKYGSNFQPFVNKRDVKDGKDEDLTAEPEMLKAFRDTWELGLHSYLSYMRDRLVLAHELLSESGSILIQIGDENVHHMREICEEVFGADNFICEIIIEKTSSATTQYMATINDYLIMFAKVRSKLKYRQLYKQKKLGESGSTQYVWIESPDGKEDRRLSKEELDNSSLIPQGWKIFACDNLTSLGPASQSQPFEYKGKTYYPNPNSHWKCIYPIGLERLAKNNRLRPIGNSLMYKRYLSDFPVTPIANIWSDTKLTGFAESKIYVVQTAVSLLQRCLLMTSDPSDLVLDITCGSGTTAYVAERLGRRWITCDTSRVAIALAKQRLMTAAYDYYELAHPHEGVSSGFKYMTVPHITLKNVSHNEPKEKEVLYDQPIIDTKKARVSGPFTIEAVPAPAVKPLSSLASNQISDESIARSGETLRISEWKDEIYRTGIRGKSGQRIKLARMEILPGTKWLHVDGETKEDSPKRIVVSFGPEHAPLEQRQVELAINEAQKLVPKPQLIGFAAFQFDPEAAKDIDETNWPGITLLKIQMNADLLTEDLKKKRSSNESFWLIGQPDVSIDKIKSGKDAVKFQVSVNGFDYYNTRTGNIESGGSDKIAMWMLDTDYDGRSLFPRQVFFPMAGEKEGWSKLAKNLKAEIDEELIDAYRGTSSIPFEVGDNKRVAVKIIDDRGIESLKIIEVE